MINVHRPEQSHDGGKNGNGQSLQSLVRAITLASGRKFSLILAHCNYRHLQDRVMQSLRDEFPVELQELRLSASARTLYASIKNEFGDRSLSALVISGLESVNHLDKLLLSANQFRDEFRKQLNFPLVLWVSDAILSEIIGVAPDFYNWAASPIAFHLSPEELTTFLQEHSEQLFEQSLTLNSLRNNSRSSELGTRLLRSEMDAALRELPQTGQTLAPDLDANVQFALGWDEFLNYRVDEAIAHYQHSLDVWQQSQCFDKASVALFYLGQCALQQAKRDRSQQTQHWEIAEEYFRQSLETCEQVERPDLKARFIGVWGDVLKRLNRWDELDALIQEADALEQRYPNLVERSRILALQAEVALAHDQAGEAYQFAQQALQCVEQSSTEQQDCGAYRLLLARSQQSLGYIEDAILTLREAHRQSTPEHDPDLYIQLLELLRTLYFQQKNYEEAFTFKREQLSVESQYGFRAFVGAGRLRPTRAMGATDENREVVAQEIAMSGRKRDVERLIERISRNDCPLTIVHGQLGVGKSSLLQAGLKPSLDQEMIQARDVVTVITRSYTNWPEKLGKCLTESLRAKPQAANQPLKSTTTILEQLRINDSQNLLTVLIFDQFEEFFFICQELSEHRSFFEFLSECLEIPFVKVILSLREDYLHYLLGWERDRQLNQENDQVLGDVLSRQHRYELTNFSPLETKEIIHTLTQKSQVHLETDLIERLVSDLADNQQTIRPIELQVVGAQLYKEKVRTLEHYLKLGDRPKEKLVQHYLDGVIRDCGPENKEAAQLVLFLLTGENNTRPPKTREEIKTDLKALEKGLVKEAEKLDLVLEIFRKSGLVFLIPELPADRYQLVHDYLVSFIRQQRPKIDALLEELKAKQEELDETKIRLRTIELEQQLSEAEQERQLAEEKQRRSETELKLARNRNKSVWVSVISVFTICLAISGSILWVKQADYSNEFAIQIGNTLRIRNKHAEDLLRHQEIDEALVESLKAGISLNKRYLEAKHTFRIGEGDTDAQDSARYVASVLQEIIRKKLETETLPLDQEGVTLHNRIEEFDPEEESNMALNMKIEELDPEELNQVLEHLVRIGCRHVSQEALAERKWKAPLCQ